MSTFKGTKGKWDLESDRTVNFGNYQGWANISWGFHGTEKIAKANTLLISKAPEMLEMLENAKQVLIDAGFEVEQLIKSATEI